MADFSVTSSQGWGGRLKNSFVGILFGIALVGGAFIGLFVNEGSAVKRYQDLNFVKDKVIPISADAIDPANEGKPIHMSGKSTPGSTPADPKFGVSAEGALKLRREVEMYQWVESSSSQTKKKVGGGTETEKTYSYNKQWSSQVEKFEYKEHPAEYKNPGSMPYQARTDAASPITVGAFTLSDSLISQLSNFNPLQLESLDAVPAELKDTVKLHGGGLYVGDDPASPAVGDVRITFSSVAAGEVSLVSQQSGKTLAPYQAKHGTVELLQTGTHTAEAMFSKAEADRGKLTWIFRLAGFVAMAIGLNLLVKPLVVMADVLPFLGNIVGAGVGIIMTLLAAFLSFITIAIAWVVYRPIIGIALLAIAGFFGYLIIKKTRGAKPPAMEPAAAGSGGDGGPPPLS